MQYEIDNYILEYIEVENKYYISFLDSVNNKCRLEITEEQIYNKLKVVIPIYHTSPANPLGYKGNVAIFEKLKDYFKLRENITITPSEDKIK